MRRLIAAGAVAVALPAGAEVTIANNRIAVFGDWSVFVADDPVECFAATRSSLLLNVPADVIMAEAPAPASMMFTVRPVEGDFGEMAFHTGGDVIRGGTVAVKVGDAAFTLIPQDEWAWPMSPDQDARLVMAMIGTDAVEVKVDFTNAGGFHMRDHFSLNGFAAAAEETARRCADLRPLS